MTGLPARDTWVSEVGSMKLLHVRANPSGSNPLACLQEEERNIHLAKEAATLSVAIEYESRAAARKADLRTALADEKPDIVHFSGHGYYDALSLSPGEGEDRDGILRVDELVAIFEPHREAVRLVVLCACNSDGLATALAAVIPVVIGLRGEAPDEAVPPFVGELYRRIWDGETIEAALAASRRAGVGLDPVLALRPGTNPGVIVTYRPRPELRALSGLTPPHLIDRQDLQDRLDRHLGLAARPDEASGPRRTGSTSRPENSRSLAGL